MSAAMRILPFNMIPFQRKRGGRLAALRARFDRVALSQRSGQARRVFAQLGNRRGLPVAGAQPWTHVVQPIYRRTRARNRPAVIADVDAERQPVGANRAARRPRFRRIPLRRWRRAMAIRAFPGPMGSMSRCRPLRGFLPACDGLSGSAGHSVDFVPV